MIIFLRLVTILNYLLQCVTITLINKNQFFCSKNKRTKLYITGQNVRASQLALERYDVFFYNFKFY